MSAGCSWTKPGKCSHLLECLGATAAAFSRSGGGQLGHPLPGAPISFLPSFSASVEASPREGLKLGKSKPPKQQGFLQIPVGDTELTGAKETGPQCCLGEGHSLLRREEEVQAQLPASLPPQPTLGQPLFTLTKTKFFRLPQLRKSEFIIEKPGEFIAVEMRKFKTHNYPAG